MRRLWYGVVALLVVVGVLISVIGAGRTSHRHVLRPAHTGATPGPGVVTHRATARHLAARPPLSAARMLGQMIVARFPGTAPSPGFLARIRKGQIGGVILFADNLPAGLRGARALTNGLQRAAAAGHNPPLLIMTDQEGGQVKRLPGPPTLAPADMSSGSVARAQGRAAGQLLRSVGVNVDLAPVADVEGIPDSFLGTRSFGSSPALVARRACAFAAGLSSAHVAYTLKHFPGLGLAPGNTDLGSVSVKASAGALRRAYGAYRSCGAGGLALVMVSSASYPALAGPLPAVMSAEIYRRELRLAVPQSDPLTISDDLQSPAIEAQSAPARHAIQSGLDLLMYAQTDQGSAQAYSKLLADVRAGAIAPARLTAAAGQILALKRRLQR